jgi:hypothetical protein
MFADPVHCHMHPVRKRSSSTARLKQVALGLTH